MPCLAPTERIWNSSSFTTPRPFPPISAVIGSPVTLISPSPPTQSYPRLASSSSPAPADVQSIYGISGILGPFGNGTNSLSNDNSSILLRNKTGAVLLEVHYS